MGPEYGSQSSRSRSSSREPKHTPSPGRSERKQRSEHGRSDRSPHERSNSQNSQSSASVRREIDSSQIELNATETKIHSNEGKVLKEESTVADYPKIQKDTTLEIRERLRGGGSERQQEHQKTLKAMEKFPGQGFIAAAEKSGENASRFGQNDPPNDLLLEDGVTLNNKYRHKVREVFTAENLSFNLSSPTSQDANSLKGVREFFAGEETHRQLSGKDRKKIKDGQKSVSFTKLNIKGLPATLRGVSTEKPLVGEIFGDVPGYVSPEQRQLKTLQFEGSTLQPAADGEAKMAEYIYLRTDESSIGTIRLVTDRPACDSCAYVLANLAKQRPDINIEVFETPR